MSGKTRVARKLTTSGPLPAFCFWPAISVAVAVMHLYCFNLRLDCCLGGVSEKGLTSFGVRLGTMKLVPERVVGVQLGPGETKCPTNRCPNHHTSFVESDFRNDPCWRKGISSCTYDSQQGNKFLTLPGSRKSHLLATIFTNNFLTTEDSGDLSFIQIITVICRRKWWPDVKVNVEWCNLKLRSHDTMVPAIWYNTSVYIKTTLEADVSPTPLVTCIPSPHPAIDPSPAPTSQVKGRVPRSRPHNMTKMSANTSQKAQSNNRNRIRLERAFQKQSSDSHKTPYDRVKRCRERKKHFKASERVNPTNSGQPIPARCLMPEAARWKYGQAANYWPTVSGLQWLDVVTIPDLRLDVAMMLGLHRLDVFTMPGLRCLDVATKLGLRRMGVITMLGLRRIGVITMLGLRRLHVVTIQGLRWLDVVTLPGVRRLDVATMPSLRRLDVVTMPGL
ncbi:hypothetical protein PR048_012734 [Dryococelus australis]|uniref:Uncharacterized protein n=1 Tax=Dryococelus australis TaxID=614101 RepID=A0ABQ9HRM9_9NEOP|nr:hypothetical protein PR048_012734 [Dryococelus australis]